MSRWFTHLEDVAYSVVEYIPLVGTVYSLQRAGIAYKLEDWTRHWQSVANFLESSVRDVILFNEIIEFPEVALLHTMAESFTDKMIEIYHHEPNKPKIKITNNLDTKSGHVVVAEPSKPNYKITNNLDTQSGHVVVAESSMGKFKRQVFEGKAKGVHHFHGAVFTGTLFEPTYARNGENIRLDIPHGLYDGARVTFSWKWTKDYIGKEKRPEATLGRIRLEAHKTYTRFELSSRSGAGGWEGYDFFGEVSSKDLIKATANIDGNDIHIDFRRVSGT